ncbi:MAG: hypothetical protein AAFZ18_16540 [Myxococcota bacterium]
MAARAAALTRRIEAQVLADAVAGGEVEAARAVLTRTIERDPQSAAAKSAVSELLKKAREAMTAGRFAEAAELYEAANAATLSAEVRSGVSQANTLLGQNKLEAAASAYAAALSGGESIAGEQARAAVEAARTAQLVASARALGSLASEVPLERAALDVRTLLRSDPTQKDGRAAVAAVLEHADAAAAEGDAAVVARDLSLAATALGQSAVMRRAVDMIRAGRLEEAEKSFTQTAGWLAERGPAIVARLRVKALASSLDEGGLSAARSIRALLRVEPEDPTALAALAAIFRRLEAAADKGDGAAAAGALREADAATSAEPQISEAIERAAVALEGGRFAEAESVLVGARRKMPRSEAVKRGEAAARDLRTNAEEAAFDGLRAGEDPRVHAATLVASRALDGFEATLARGRRAALDRASAAAKQDDMTTLARSLAAAGQLVDRSAEGAIALTEAAELVAKEQLAEAEEAYGGLGGEVAARARSLMRSTRISRARAAVKAAAEEGRLLDEADANQALLALAPKDREARARQRRLAQEVRATRTTAARRQLDLGKPGLAWLYVERALRLDPKDRTARALRDEAEEALEKSKDLIMVIEAVRFDGASTRGCGPVDTELQAQLMSELSQRTDLNGYVLSEGWTKAWREKDPRAPSVTGGLAVLVQGCTVSPGAGQLQLGWAVQTPKGGKSTAAGDVSSEVLEGSLLIDERDAAGNNVRKLLIDRALEAIVNGLQGESAAVRQWLLTSAEHALSEGNPERAADAFARFLMNPVNSADPERVSAIETALAKAFR